MGSDKDNVNISPGNQTTIDENFEARLKTFEDKWTGRKDMVDIARAGFKFTGVDDKVECPFCGLKLLNWTPTDDPLHEHATRRPLCSFINSRYRQLGQNKPPKHPQYQELQARLDSFVGWPGRFVPKTPEELAAAGFFYIGSADRVTCFQCGITLRDWEEEHDPVIEHQRYSENCQFINNTDLNQLGVNTRQTDLSDTNQLEQATENKENIGACGGGSSSMSGNVSNSPTLPTTEDDLSVSVCREPTVTTKQQNHEPESEPSNKDKRPLFESTNSTIQISETASVSPKILVSGPTKKLAEENKRLKARRTCKVCKKEQVSILFLPCAHLVTCSNCAPEVSDCITCGRTIVGTAKIYFA